MVLSCLAHKVANGLVYSLPEYQVSPWVFLQRPCIIYPEAQVRRCTFAGSLWFFQYVGHSLSSVLHQVAGDPGVVPLFLAGFSVLFKVSAAPVLATAHINARERTAGWHFLRAKIFNKGGFFRQVASETLPHQILKG